VDSVSERNKRKVQLFVDAVLNEGRLELIDELVAADYLGHLPCADTVVTGPAGVRELVAGHRRAHPGVHVKIEDQIAEDDRVVTHWQATIAAPGAPGDGAPTARISCCTGISIIRFLAGKQIDSRTACTNLTANRGAGA